MEDQDLSSILANEYGIRVFREDISEDEMKERHYRKATDDEAAHFDAFFQFAPRIAKDAYYANSVQKAFDSAVKGTYRLKLDPQFHLGKSHTTPGAFKGNAYDASNHLKTQADWLLNDAKLDVSMVPEIASCVMNLASFITGQYFMAQINKNFQALRSETEEIKQFLVFDKDSTISQAIRDLSEIRNHLPFINQSPERINQSIHRLAEIQKVAGKYIDFSKRNISTIKHNSSDDDKGEAIKKYLKKCVDTLTQLCA